MGTCVPWKLITSSVSVPDRTVPGRLLNLCSLSHYHLEACHMRLQTVGGAWRIWDPGGSTRLVELPHLPMRGGVRMRLAWLPRSGFLPAALGLEHGRGRRDEKPRERKSILRSVLRHVQGRPSLRRRASDLSGPSYGRLTTPSGEAPLF